MEEGCDLRDMLEFVDVLPLNSLRLVHSLCEGVKVLGS